MDPVNSICLAAIVFLSLPLPLFASAAIASCPSARRLVMPWVWAHCICGSACGLLVIAAPLPPWWGLALAAAGFIGCGMQMAHNLAATERAM
jgi:hypothetical protein